MKQKSTQSNRQAKRRVVALTAANLRLRRGIVQSKVTELAFNKNDTQQSKCLGESLQKQKRQRQLTHRVLAAQEDDRKKISHELQDEVAQTLLGINARLLALKRNARSSLKDLKKEIASTRRLVVKSARSVRRFARELDHPQDE